MTDDINRLKKELRKRLIYERSLIEDDKRILYDGIILDKVMALKEYREADTILVYASYKGEADTYGLIKRALSDGKNVACPRCRFDKEVPLLDFYRIGSADELIEGFKGIPEPAADKDKLLKQNETGKAVVIVPLVGYDGYRNRLGYGKGFYDRFLGTHEGLYSVGLAYGCQKCREVPVDKYDIRLNMIISELQE